MVPSPSYRHCLNNRLIYPAEREGMLLPMIQIYQFHIHPVQNTLETSERYWSSFQWYALGQIPRAVHKNGDPPLKLVVPENDEFPYDLIQCPELPPCTPVVLIHIKSTYKILENAIGNFFVKTPPRLEEYPPCLIPNNQKIIIFAMRTIVKTYIKRF